MFNATHFHPMTVHFPVALIMVGFLAELLSLFFKKEAWLSKASLWLMILGSLGAIVSYLTGEYFTVEYTGKAGDLKETHELFAKITMWVIIAATLIRLFLSYLKKDESNIKWMVFILYFIAALSVAITGFLGGSLVYNYLIK